MKFNFSNDAMKAIGKLDVYTAGRVIKGIIGLPGKGDIKPLSGKHAGQFRLRIGDWRIIYTVENKDVFVGYILPRGDAYK